MEKNNKHLITIYILLFIALICNFIPRSCSEVKESITVPEMSGTFDTIKPKEVKGDKEYIYITKYKTKIVTQHPINDSVVKEFEKASDSTKIDMFVEKTKIRQYNEVFENDTIRLSIFAEIAGELLKMSPSWLVKERKMDIITKQKETVFALYGGVRVYNTLLLSNPGVEGNVGFQMKRGDIIEAGYDTNQNISIGYKYRLLNIRK